MNLCEKLLATCISVDCDNAVYSGMDQIGWIFNRSEVDLVATEASGNKDATNANIYKSIVMKERNGVAYTGYVIQQLGKQPYTGSTIEMSEGSSMNKFNTTISFVVPDNSPAASLILDNLANGKFVMVLANDYTGSDSKGKYQIYGIKKGLTASAITCEKYSEDTDGGWSVQLVEENAPNSSLFLVHTTDNVDDTETYLGTITDCD